MEEPRGDFKGSGKSDLTIVVVAVVERIVFLLIHNDKRLHDIVVINDFKFQRSRF